MNQTVNNGDTIKIHYTGRLADGSIFDSSNGREPLEFKVGSGQVIPGFDAGVMNMEIGQKKEINIPCKEAYGETNPQMIFRNVPLTNLPPTLKPQIGMPLNMTTPEGYPVQVTIIELTETEMTLDANHSLAGKDLIFDLELVSMN
jgi:peptidylprolyl isomerase